MALHGLRRRMLLGAIATLAVACSLTSLDGYSGGVATQAKGDASAEGGPTPAGDATMPPDHADTGPTVPADSYAAAVLADAPGSYYRFEEAPGAVIAKDETGAHPASLGSFNGGPAKVTLGVPGVRGTGLRTGRPRGGFVVGDYYRFDGKSEWTIELWAQNEAPEDTYESVISKRLDGNPGLTGWVVFMNKDNRSIELQFWKGELTFRTYTEPLAANRYSHLVFTTRKNSDGELDSYAYLDGVEQDGPTLGWGDSQPSSSQPLVIGVNWSGTIDEVAFYTHALSSDRVRAHHVAALSK